MRLFPISKRRVGQNMRLFPLSKRRVGQNIDVHAAPADRTSTYLVSASPIQLHVFHSNFQQ